MCGHREKRASPSQGEDPQEKTAPSGAESSSFWGITPLLKAKVNGLPLESHVPLLCSRPPSALPTPCPTQRSAASHHQPELFWTRTSEGVHSDSSGLKLKTDLESGTPSFSDRGHESQMSQAQVCRVGRAPKVLQPWLFHCKWYDPEQRLNSSLSLFLIFLICKVAIRIRAYFTGSLQGLNL